jgi:hypothetical protein
MVETLPSFFQLSVLAVTALAGTNSFNAQSDMQSGLRIFNFRNEAVGQMTEL